MVKTLIILIFLFTNAKCEKAKEEYEKGSSFLLQGKYSEAILAFNAALEKNPYYKEAYNKLGLTYYQKKEYKNAISSFKKALALDSSYNEVNNNLGLAYEEDGRIDDAIKSFKNAIKQEPTNPEYRYNLAGCLYKKGLIFDAIKEYKRVIEIEPSFYLADIKLGDIYWKDKKLKDDAIMSYEDAKAKAPKSSLAHISLGRLYFENKEIDKAIWEYKKAISKNKNLESALIELGRLYIEKEDYKEAENIYKRLDGLVADNLLIKYTLGFIYEKQKMYQEALSSYENALSISKNDELSQFSKERVLFLLKEPVFSERRKEASFLAFAESEHYLKKGMISLSIHQHKRAISLNPQDVKIRLSLARLYENNGMFSLALNEIAKVVELEPQNIEASDAIERISFKRKKTIGYQEGIGEIPASPLRLAFFGIFSKGFCAYPSLLDYLNELLAGILSYSKKLSLYYDPSKSLDDKNKAISLAREKGADFLLLGELKQEKIEVKLIDLLNLKEEDIIIEREKKLKEAIYYLTAKVDGKLPIKGRIFKIKEGNAFINVGSLSGIKEQDVLNLLEDGKVIAKIKVIKVDSDMCSAIILPPQIDKILEIGKEVYK